MSNLNTLSAWSPRLLSVLRIITGFLFFVHGSQKLFGFPPTFTPRWGGLPPLILTAGVLEFFGGLLLLIGLFTRPVAFLMSGLMSVAYFMSHAPQGFWPILNKGELAALYSFLFLYFAAAGGGPWSADSIWRKGKL
jgi:putative oxidoreductase